ncbi:MAG: CHAD domain-containing protein [Candidatus Sulfotelmatobacter sp.]
MSMTRERSSVVFQRLERDLVKLSSKPVAENVHRFRTGTRRLQTLLQELSPQRDRKQKKLLKLLGRIRKRAGKVRDVDVQLAALRRLKFPQEPRRKTQLMHRLIELRSDCENKLGKALDKETLREVRKRLKRASKDFDSETTLDPLTVARRMLEQIEHPDTTLTEQLLHQYRIFGKRARYAAEFAPKSAQAAQFITEVKRMQDALGDWRDWLTLTQTAGEQLGSVRESPLVAELHNVTGAKFRHAVTVLAQVRAKLSLTSEHPAHVPARVGAKPSGQPVAAA